MAVFHNILLCWNILQKATVLLVKYVDGLLLQVTCWQQHDFIEKVAAISGDNDTDCELRR